MLLLFFTLKLEINLIHEQCIPAQNLIYITNVKIPDDSIDASNFVSNFPGTLKTPTVLGNVKKLKFQHALCL
jgi:hypothetical protein